MLVQFLLRTIKS